MVLRARVTTGFAQRRGTRSESFMANDRVTKIHKGPVFSHVRRRATGGYSTATASSQEQRISRVRLAHWGRDMSTKLLVIGAAIASTFFVSCTPAEVRNCHMSSDRSGDPIFDAGVQSRGTITRIDVIATSTNADQSDPRTSKLSIGPLSPGGWQHPAAAAWTQSPWSAEISGRFSPPGARRDVTSCFVQAVLFPDGQIKILYNPL
jgi:hypothetical protein